jgi:magnesium-transporting ATPase (P-type)
LKDPLFALVSNFLVLAYCLFSGVNDSPALSAANIGIAMGSGTAVAQQASNMVVVDDNFCTIVEAVKHGRAIYANIQKFVLFLFATNSSQVVIILLAVAIGIPVPLEPLPILFVNLTCDGLASVALSLERGEQELMSLPPRDAKTPILHGNRLIMLLVHGILLTGGIMMNFLLGLWFFTGHILTTDLSTAGSGLSFDNCREYVNLNTWKYGLTREDCQDGIARARTMAFIVIVWTEVFRGYTVRSWLRPVWVRLFGNHFMLFTTVLTTGLALVFILAPGANDVFGLTSSLPYFGWLIAFGTCIFITICDEIVKYKFYSHIKQNKRWRLMKDNFAQVLGEMRAVNHKLTDLEREILWIKRKEEAKEARSKEGGNMDSEPSKSAKVV